MLETDDLIDLSSTVSTGSMSKIPVPSLSSKASLSAGSRSFGHTLRSHRSSTSLNTYETSVPSTPDLAVDMFDAMSTQSSGPSTPPSISPPLRKSRDSLTHDLKGSGGIPGSRGYPNVYQTTPTPSSKVKKTGIDITIPQQLPPDAKCAKCALPLFNTKFGGKFVTVPEAPTSTGVPPKTFHTACFKCNVCHEVFEEREGGHAVFVRGEEGACHVRVSVDLSYSLHPRTNEIR